MGPFTRPGAYDALLEYIKQDPTLSFVEDFAEEARLQSILDSENQEYKITGRGRQFEYVPRPNNHVYVITKK